MNSNGSNKIIIIKKLQEFKDKIKKQMNYRKYMQIIEIYKKR